MGRRTVRFKTLKSAFWLCSDLVVGLWEVMLSFFVVFHLQCGGREAMPTLVRELFSIKMPANHPTTFPPHTPPSPGPRLLCLAWHMVEIPPKAPFPVSAWQEDTTSKNTVEMMRNRRRQPYTCQDMQEFREFCPFASGQTEKSGMICSGT